jgi:hypothetical protein
MDNTIQVQTGDGGSFTVQRELFYMRYEQNAFFMRCHASLTPPLNSDSPALRELLSVAPSSIDTLSTAVANPEMTRVSDPPMIIKLEQDVDTLQIVFKMLESGGELSGLSFPQNNLGWESLIKALKQYELLFLTHLIKHHCLEEATTRKPWKALVVAVCLQDESLARRCIELAGQQADRYQLDIHPVLWPKATILFVGWDIWRMLLIAASQAGNPVPDDEVDDPCMPITHGQHIDWKEVALFFKIYTE